MEVSIIIPTYNERRNIEKLIPEIETVLKENKIEGEIIIVDDNSPDGTGELADKLAERYTNIRVIHREKKEGVGSARKVGFSAAKKKVILSMEGDNTHNPKYIPSFLKKIEEGNDLVVGSRYLPDSKIINWPLKRRVVSKVANFIARTFSGAGLTDFTSGYRAFTREMHNRLLIESYGFPFNMEFACEAYTRGFKVAEIPIEFISREDEKSKMNVTKEFHSFLYVAFKFAYTYRPMHTFGLFGLTISSIGFVLGTYILCLKFIFHSTEAILPWMLFSALLIISGIQILSFGFIVGILTKFRREIL